MTDEERCARILTGGVRCQRPRHDDDGCSWMGTAEERAAEVLAVAAGRIADMERELRNTLEVFARCDAARRDLIVERDALRDLMRRVFQATPSSIDRPDHDPEGLWQALGYDVEDGATDTDCEMERSRVEVEALLRDVNRALGCALPLPPHVPCEDTDDVEPCDTCKASS